MQLIFAPAEPLAPGDDEDVAKAIEAGVYAAHLIDHNGPSAPLERIVEAGLEAEQRLWNIGLRIAYQQSLAVARAYLLPFDDLFQDSCIAVAEAIRRYDYTRQVRFTTYVFDLVRWTLANGSAHRPGAAVSRTDRSAAQKVARMQDRLAADGIVVGLDTAARMAGVSSAAASRATGYTMSLDDVAVEDLEAQFQFAEVEGVNYDFLELLTPRNRRILEVRYGLGGEAPQTLVQAARTLRTSAPTVHRWEQRALAQARQILTADRTTAATAEAAAAVA